MKSRLAEHFNRIVRDDCLTLFNRTIDLSRIECSIVLANASQLSTEQKYKAAAVLTVLTGQVPAGEKCRVEWDDPLALRLSKAQQQIENRTRSAALARQFNAKLNSKKNSTKQVKTQQKMTSEDFKEASAGFKLVCNIGKVRMWDFLEKLREFCLPDTSGVLDSFKGKDGIMERGHDNDRPDAEIRRQFQRLCLVKEPSYNPRMAIGMFDNPDVALTAYILKAHELLKFPDIEVYFEALSEVLKDSSERETNNPVGSNSVRIILRPLLRVTQPSIDAISQSVLPPVDNLRIMNWLLAQFFNEYLHRPLIAIR